MNGKAVIAHGAASSADFVHRAFAKPLADIDYELVTWDRRTPVNEADHEFAALVEQYDAGIIGGVSVGAILAANYAIAHPNRLAGLLLALPPPGPTSGEILSVDAEVAARDAVPWVAAELRAAWPMYSEEQLRNELETAAGASPPAVEALRRITVPTGVVGFADDPVHPLEVADAWASAIPNAAIEVLRIEDAADDVAVIGTACLRAYLRAAPHL